MERHSWASLSWDLTLKSSSDEKTTLERSPNHYLFSVEDGCTDGLIIETSVSGHVRRPCLQNCQCRRKKFVFVSMGDVWSCKKKEVRDTEQNRSRQWLSHRGGLELGTFESVGFLGASYLRDSSGVLTSMLSLLCKPSETDSNPD